MPRLNFVKKARKDIYAHGKLITKIHQRGKNAGKEYITRDRSQPEDDKDTLIIKKGESYYWWQFAFSSKRISKTRPPQSALTQSEYYGWLWDLQDGYTSPDYTDESAFELLQNDIDELIDQLNEQMEELQDKLDSMPEQLQESSDAGMMLQERIDSLENAVNELECISLDYNEDDDAEEIERQFNEYSEEVGNILGGIE